MLKLIQAVKNRKGFTLMELIVVLIILAILIAALTPVLIGWINDARESAIRAEGRTVLLAMQTVITEAKGTGTWSNNTTEYAGVSSAALLADTRFQDLMNESGMTAPGKFDLDGLFQTTTGTDPAVTGLFFDNGNAETGNLVGIRVRNTASTTRASDGAVVGAGNLLVGSIGSGEVRAPLP